MARSLQATPFQSGLLPHFHIKLVAAALAAALAGCGGGSGNPATPPAPPPIPAQTVSLSVAGHPMLGSKPVTVSATLDHSADLSWSLASANPGTLSASTGSSVTYTPPATRVSTITPITLTATSAGVSRSIRLTLYPASSPAGLSLIAGDLGARAILDGSGSSARFNDIKAMAADTDGSMVLVDLGDYLPGTNPSQVPSTIRRINAAGLVTTLYRPAFGHADGSPGTAKIGNVTALAIAPDHALLVLDNDTVNNYVRHIAPNGAVSTLATLVADQRFSTGVKLHVDGNGNILLISSLAVYSLRNGAPVLVAGQERGGEGSVDGNGSAARFLMIGDSVVDSGGNLYLIDNFAIRKVTPAGQTSTLAGVANNSAVLDGSGGVARFGTPESLALDAQGNLLVLDRDPSGGGRSGYLIRRITPSGIVSTPYSGADPEPGAYPQPLATASRNRLLRVSSDERIILASVGQVQVQQNASSARLLAGLEGDSGSERDGQGAAARFVNPYGLAPDLNGNLYVLDGIPAGGGYQLEAGGIRLRKISPEGLVSSIPVSSTLVPSGMVTDGDGNLYISVRGPLSTLTGVAPGGAIFKITPQGSASILAGSQQMGTGTTPVDGTGSAALFVRPTVQGVDADGNLYVKDDNYFVTPSVTSYRKVTPQAVVSTIPALPANLSQAPDGSTYSIDPERSVIYRVAADGNKTLVAGDPERRGTVLGNLPAGLDRPRSIVPIGPDSFAVISGAAILRLVVPH